MNNYARLEDFDSIIHVLANDNTLLSPTLTAAEVLACFSVSLTAFAAPDLPPETHALVLHLARMLADVLIAHYPRCEGYIDFLFGVAILNKTDF